MELDRPFGVNGIREDFSNDLSPDGDMSLEQGFTDFFQRKIGGGGNGRQIQLGKFNQLMYLISKGVLDNKDAIEALEGEFGSLENILTNNTPKLLTQNLEWEIGVGGKFTSLKSALDEACKYKSSNFNITIKIKSGTTITEDIEYDKGVDLSFVTITSEDNIVQCSSSNFSFLNCLPPIISCKFNFTKANIVRFNNCNKILIKGSSSKKAGFSGSKQISFFKSFIEFDYADLETSATISSYFENIAFSGCIGTMVNSKIKINNTTNAGAVSLSNTFYLCLLNIVNTKFDYTNTTNANITMTSFYEEESLIRLSGCNFNINGNIYINITRASKLTLSGTNTINSSNNNVNYLFSIGDGSSVTYDTKPIINHIGAKANIPYGQLTTIGAFCQTLE